MLRQLDSGQDGAMPGSLAGNDLLLQRVARAISRRGLHLPALILLEAGRPFSFLGAQLLWIAQPGLRLFVPGVDVGRIARLLEEPETADALIGYLETETPDE
jgi:hypothetical protein